MSVEAVEGVVRSLVVALMSGLLYFPGHRRVVRATEEVVAALEGHFESQPLLVLGIREGLLIFEGRPLYDLSIYAHRLIRTLREREAWGLRFERGVTVEEVRRLVEVLLESPSASAEVINGELSQQGVTRVALEVQPVVERGVAMEGIGPGEAGKALEGEEISREIYTSAMAVLQDIMVELRQGEQASFSQANEVAAVLAEAMETHRTPLIALTAVKNYDEYTFNHSVNVCIYTTALAEGLAADPQEVVRIAQAALLHDVGKILIADEILYKPGRLSEAEWRVMRQHPLVGAKILVEAQGVDELAVNVAFGHHLRHDRGGYPEVTGQVEIDPVTELVNVVDVYEAVAAKRPYKKPVAPERVAELLLDGSGRDFNPVCVEAFLGCLGAYPPATRVLLENGCQGEVVSTSPEDPFHPRVRVTRDPEGESVRGGEVVDTAERDEAGGYRCEVVRSVPRPEPALNGPGEEVG